LSFSSEGFLDYESKTRDFWINLREENSGVDWGKLGEIGRLVGEWEREEERELGVKFARVMAKRHRFLPM
jgi:hypothetical protein